MARIRTIKPEFWTSEQVAECSATARLMFIGLWNFCDDNGIHPANVKRIKMQIFPADPLADEDIHRLLDELTEAGLLRLYVVDGKAFVIVTGWHHQRIDKPSYKYPKPPWFDDHSENGIGMVAERSDTDGNVTERNGTECNGREGNVRSSTSDVGVGDQKFSFDWEEARRDANKALKKLHPCKSDRDRSLLIKAAALKQKFGDDWFWDAVEGAHEIYKKPKPPAVGMYGYLHGIWKQKCSDLTPAKVFSRALQSVNVPEEVLQPKVIPGA